MIRPSRIGVLLAVLLVCVCAAVFGSAPANNGPDLNAVLLCNSGGPASEAMVIVPHAVAVDIVRDISPGEESQVQGDPVVRYGLVVRHRDLFMRHLDAERSSRELVLLLRLILDDKRT